jgi:hypothetical protein
MEQEFIFRASFFTLGILSKAWYLTWPFYSLCMAMLILNRFRPLTLLHSILMPSWWVLTVTCILLISCFLIALITMPKDGGSGLVFYTAFMVSLPILIPCLIAIFFKPN